MSLGISQIKEDLYDWIDSVTDWVIMWADQNAPRPDEAFISLKFNSPVQIGEVSRREPNIDTVVITLDADLVTSNKINVTVNGIALSETTFATDHLTTMGVIAGKIQAVTAVDTAVVGGTDDLVITVTGVIDQDVIVNFFVVTLGAGQATADILRGANALIAKDNEFTLSVQGFGDDSMQELTNIRDLLETFTVQGLLRAASLAFVQVLNFSDITGLFQSRFEPRASLDLLFRINSTVTEDAGVIETVTGFP